MLSITTFKFIAKINKQKHSSLGHSLDALSQKLGFKNYNAIKPTLIESRIYFQKDEIKYLKFLEVEKTENDLENDKLSLSFLEFFKKELVPDDFTEENIQLFVDSFIQRMFYFFDNGICSIYENFEEFYIEEIFANPGAWISYKRSYFYYLLYKDNRFKILDNLYFNKYGRYIH